MSKFSFGTISPIAVPYVNNWSKKINIKLSIPVEHIPTLIFSKKSFTLKDVSSSSHSILNVPISRTSLEIAASIAGTASLKDEYSLNLNFDNGLYCSMSINGCVFLFDTAV